MTDMAETPATASTIAPTKMRKRIAAPLRRPLEYFVLAAAQSSGLYMTIVEKPSN
jgi:hypothetical protein